MNEKNEIELMISRELTNNCSKISNHLKINETNNRNQFF